MKSLWTSFVLIAAFTVANDLPISAQSQEQLYQEGLMKEEGEGALQDAIALYSQIADNTSADQSLRAKSLLHIGMCYEKMGTQEAVKAYQRLVSSFPAQKNEVAIAHERLNRLLLTAENATQKNPVPKFTRIRIPSEPWFSTRLSPNGEKIAMVNDRKLWIMPVSGNAGPDIPGQPVQLNTNEIQPEKTSPLSWSDDGKWIAFNEQPNENRPVDVRWNQSIYAVPVTGGQPEKVVENFRDFTNRNYSISLSPDGKTLAHTAVVDNKQFIYTTQVIGGSQKKLVGIQAREPAFSPDGKWIAFVEDKVIGHDGGNLCIVPSTGGDPITLVKLNKASSPVWSPDGKTIAFIDEEENKKIKFVRIQQNGQRIGNVASVKIPGEMEKVDLLTGWGTNNKLGAILSTEQDYSIYTLPAKGGQASMLLNDRLALQPRWSASGDEIIFITIEQDQPFIPPALLFATVPSKGGSAKILRMEHNTEKVIPGPPELGRGISPDGRSLIFCGWTMSDTTHDLREPATSIWTYSFEDHSTRKLTNEKGLFVDRFPSWSPDGRKIAFTRYNVPEGSVTDAKKINSGIYTMNSSGGDIQMLYSDDDLHPIFPVWSPDGKMITYISRLKEDDKYVLNVIDVQDGTSRVVYEIPEFISTIDPCWSPDSKKIAYNDGKVIKVVHLDDGSVEDIQTNLTSDVNIIYYLDWSPGGESFVFGGANQGQSEFWFVEDFLPLDKLPDQSGPVVAEKPEGIQIRQVWKESGLDFLGSVSSDGSLLSYVFWGQGDVAVHNLNTGMDHVLIYEADLEGSPQGFAQAPKISKDGRKIAYFWWRPNHTFDLRLTDVSNPSSRCLYKEEGVEVYPETWLSDHELIALRQNRNTEITSISLFNMNDGTYRDLKTFKGRKWAQTVASPDEKYLAYDVARNNEGGNSDISLLPVRGGNEISLIQHPANDKVLGWDPEKEIFLFISDRSGEWDLWALPMDEQRSIGPAKRIYTGIGEVEPMGCTENGDLYVGFSKRYFGSSILPFNSETGEIREESGEIREESGLTIEGSNFLMQWSPDGNYLSYFQEARNSPWKLIIRDIKSGEERQFANNLLPGSYRWSPDGNSILIFGRDLSKINTTGYKGAIYLMDASTGNMTEILSLSDYDFIPSDDDASPLSTLAWAPDGHSFYMLFFRDRCIRHDLKNGKDEVVYRNPLFEEYIMQVSPDGNSLLLGTQHQEEKSRLFTIPPEGGDEIDLCSAQEANDFVNAFWSPDGKYIYFIERPDDTNLWRIPATGGKPEKLKTWDNWTDVYNINPDMNQIAISQRVRTTEVRVVENLSSELDKVFKE